ncbi:MAG TPA: toll/interleukin-1 receptor domain-containing protein, partial [Longimicrobiaceae bacterium]|nr:toll/interleukin-1 receptor domain-containing protein [Longimicrobiaceae bacterium]
MASPTRDLVFISYAHEDATWLERVQKFLKPYVRQGQLQIWADPYLKAGDLWKREIDTALSRAAVGVVLVSPDCLASDFIMDVEVPALLAAAERDDLTIFCIPISSTPWRITDLRHYQWARDGDDPLDLLEVPQRNRALVEITEKLAEAATVRASRVELVTASPVVAHRDPVAPIIAAPSGRPGALRGVPDLPPHYLPRPEDLGRLREALLGGSGSAMGITGVSYKLGLQGQGGIGKSVLAAALARDEE